jgi:monofunctional biosynthetic peptidoglycan transglycosylase
LILAAGTLLLVLPWRWLPVPTSSFMLRSWVESRQWPSQHWVPWEEISPHLAIAVVAAEDQKFPLHHGFDLQAIQEALDDDGGRRRGASTLTQQVAKNLYLWPGRSLLRKGAEAYLTAVIELTWPKRRILEVYLNIAEFGPGIYGAEAAGRHFFGRKAKNLTPRQAALLAAVLPSPRRRSPVRPSALVTRRADRIERQVRNLDGAAYLRSL